MFGKKKEEPVAVVEETIVEEKKDVFVKADKTVIGPGITMVGDFTGKDPVLVNGTIKGTVLSEGNVHISKTGQLLGDATVNSVDIDGYINGNVDCKQTASFSDTGKMQGTLSTVRLSTADGSNFEGTLNLKHAPAVKPQEIPVAAEETAQEPAAEA